MEVEGSPPVSSGLYMAMRKRLSENLVSSVEVVKSHHVDAKYEASMFQDSFLHRGVTSSDLLKDIDAGKALVDLALMTVDATGVGVGYGQVRPGSSPDYIDGLKYLSRRRCLTRARQHRDLHVALENMQRVRPPLCGKLKDMVDMLNKGEKSKPRGYMSKTVSLGPRREELYVGPLSANEVANLLILAQKLQEECRIDQALKKDIESSSHAWKKTGKVPNVVSKTLVAAIYEGLPYQCVTCGVRLSSPDLKNSHGSVHDKQRREVLWSTVDSWIKMPSQRNIAKHNQRTMLTLAHFQKLLDRKRGLEAESITWLRNVLCLRSKPTDEKARGETDITAEESIDIYPIEQESGVIINNSQDLWSWGIMGSCPVVPESPDESAATGVNRVEENRMLLLRELCNRVEINLARCLDNVPFPVAEASNSRRTCVFCHDPLEMEYSKKYGVRVFLNTVCFKMNHEIIRKCFVVSEVSLEGLLSTEALEKIDNSLDVLKKVASLKLLKSRLWGKGNELYTNWTVTGGLPTIGDKLIMPNRKDNQAAESGKIYDRLIRQWRGPFAVTSGENAVPNCLLYAHLECMKAVLNAHILRLKQLGCEGPCKVELSALKVI